MQTEVFNTELDFNLKFPSKLYTCSNCNQITNNPYECSYCGWRADGLLKTMDKGYKYTILETDRTEEIFRPIEL